VPWEWTYYKLWKNVYGCTPLELEQILEERFLDDVLVDLACYNFEQQRQSMRK